MSFVEELERARKTAEAWWKIGDGLRDLASVDGERVTHWLEGEQPAGMVIEKWELQVLKNGRLLEVIEYPHIREATSDDAPERLAKVNFGGA